MRLAFYTTSRILCMWDKYKGAHREVLTKYKHFRYKLEPDLGPDLSECGGCLLGIKSCITRTPASPVYTHIHTRWHPHLERPCTAPMSLLYVAFVEPLLRSCNIPPFLVCARPRARRRQESVQSPWVPACTKIKCESILFKTK